MTNINPSMMIYQHETIDMIDILIKLLRRKHILLWSLFFSLIAGVAYLYTKSRVYSYVTAIEIGSQMTETGTQVFFENAQTVKSKLNTAYIPQVLHNYAKTHPDNRQVKDLKFNVVVPKLSKLIVLRAQGKQNQSEMLLEIEQQIIDAVTKDHARILNVIRSSIFKKKADAEAELAYLQNEKVFDVTRKQLQAKLVTAQSEYDSILEPGLVKVKRKVLENTLKGVKNKLELLIDQGKKLSLDRVHLQKAETKISEKVEAIKQQIQQSFGKRDQAVKDVTNPTQAMTLLMIDSEIQQARRFLTKLEEQLFIKMANRLSKQEVLIKDNQRQQNATQDKIRKIELDLLNFDKKLNLEGAPVRADIEQVQAELSGIQVDRDRNIQQQVQKIQDLKIQIDNLSPTRSVAAPMQSLNPLGMGRFKTLAIFALLGIAIGFVLIVILEMTESARTRMKTLEKGRVN
ncbi:MAG TPA: hypothetical protein ENJ32_04055 [Crenotrichaceae bacterium]|nr:hypothetical protein [Crenotrichaceae bacterium]